MSIWTEFKDGYKSGVTERKHYRHIDVPKEKMVDAFHHIVPAQLEWVVPFEAFLHVDALELTR